MTKKKRQLGRSLDVFQDFERREASGPAHDAAAGMRCRSAHVEILDGRAELRVSRHRPQEEKLLERKLALENVAFAQSPLAFEVERRHHLAVKNDVFNVGRVLGDGVDDVSPKASF